MTGRESVVFDRVADTYDHTRGGMERARVAAAALHRMLPADGPLLEIGVGTGLVAAALAELGRAPAGLDLSRPMLERARPRLPGRLAVGDAERLPVRSGAVAGAYLVHVLHLVGDMSRALSEVARVLRPGGLAVATVFAYRPLDADMHREFDAVRRQLERGAQPDSEDRVVALAGAAGLAPVDRQVLPGVPYTPRRLAALLEARAMSWMWSVEEDTWARHVPAALARLRALPDQDRVRPGPGPTLLAFARS